MYGAINGDVEKKRNHDVNVRNLSCLNHLIKASLDKSERE